MLYTPRVAESLPSPFAGEHIRLSEILSALTFALDLTEGALPGHNLRSCLLGMRLAEAIGLPHSQRASLYYTLQLKDIGCSGNAARVTALVGGDDRLLKRAVKLEDLSHPYVLSPRMARVLWGQTLPGAPLPDRVTRILKVARSQYRNQREIVALQCKRATAIVRRLDMGPAVAQAVCHVDEHWDGSGFPDGLRGEKIPLLSRICSVAQNLDVMAVAHGPDRAVRALRTRRKSWFDPELAWAAESLASEGLLWKSCLPSDDAEETRSAVLDLDPGLRSDLSTERLDRICEVFADVVDTKSPFTFRHSLGVTDVAQAIAEQLGLRPERRLVLRRAALLHDLGKLAVPNSILDKPAKLSEGEWEVMRQHPGLSGAILRRVPALRGVAMLAEEHHERLDGSGYPRRLTSRDLSLDSRIIAIADVYAAMVERRPYRDPIDPPQALEILSSGAGSKFDITCFEALEATSSHWSDPLPTPGGAIPGTERQAPAAAVPLWA